MKKNMQRIMATILTVIMMVSMLPSNIFAADFDADMFVEPAVEAVSVPAEEQEVESTVEYVGEEPAEEVLGASDEFETIDADDPADPAADEIEAEADAPVVDDKTTLKAEGKDYVVTVTYDAFANLPDDVKVIVKEIKENAKKYDDYCDQALEAVQQENADVDELSYVRLFDISLVDAAGNTLEPESAVDVQIRLKDVESVEDTTQVVHFAGEEETPEVINPEIEGDTLSFESGGFSIYAVIGTGEHARLTVNFYNIDPTSDQQNPEPTLIETMYVKKADQTDDEGGKTADQKLKQIIHDPGAGTIPEGYAFYGWSIDEKDYSVESTGSSIQDVRDYIKTLEFSEGDVLNVYAMLVTYYRVDYIDYDGLNLGSDRALVKKAGDPISYTVNKNCSTDSEHDFRGWHVASGSENITGSAEDPSGEDDEEPLFPNGTSITITGNVTFSAYAVAGHWLVFNENGKHAKYNAPRFYETDEVTAEPCTNDEMIRPGYSFEGWYDGAPTEENGDPTGNLFVFGNTLEQTTTLYAKWKKAETANYTVIIWLENIAGDDYDFDRALTFTGNVDDPITVTAKQVGSDDRDTFAEINGVVYGPNDPDDPGQPKYYKGFSYHHHDTDVMITPEGDSVVNVYYNRNTYTLTFTVPILGTQSFSARYGTYIGDRFPLDITVFDGFISSFLDSRFGKWTPTTPSDKFTHPLSYIDIMPAEDVSFSNRILDSLGVSQKTINYYGEVLPGEQGTVTFNGKSFRRLKQVSAYYRYFTKEEDFMDITGYEKYGTSPDFGSSNEIYFRDTLNCYYTRKLYKINYSDGTYYDGNDHKLKEGSGTLKSVNDIPYESDVSSYNNYYRPDDTNEYIFEGWYVDKPCTTPYTFNKMPIGGITVYAKWRQVEYRVFLRPNAGKDTTLNWGSESQKTNFRVAYGDSISLPVGTRTGYKFYGWHYDPALKNPVYGEKLPLSEANVWDVYNKTLKENMTDDSDKWGNADATTNADVGSPWITKRFELFASWGKIIKGDGVGIIYDAGTDENGALGTITQNDNVKYQDNTTAIAASAPTPRAGKVFEKWIVQKWNGSAFEDTDVEVLPCQPFTVHVDDAQIIDEGGNIVITDAGDGQYTYNIQVRAEYSDAEEETSTHITWYKNDGYGDAYKTDDDLKINQRVSVYGLGGGEDIPGWLGHKFLGWAKDIETPVDEDGNPMTDDTGEIIVNTSTKKTRADFLEYKDDAYYLPGTTTVVEEVAADEILPYEGLYAVWEVLPQIQIYHSSTGDIETIQVKDIPADGLDLTGKVLTGNLYGGYYHYIDGEKGTAYEANGKALKVTEADYGTTYYLKEVPNTYLIPTIYLTYSTLDYDPPKPLRGLWIIMNVDSTYKDSEYKQIGFVRDGTDAPQTGVYDDLTVTKNGKTTTYTMSNFYGPDTTEGVLAIQDMSDYATLPANKDKSFTLSAYWVTPDNVKVTGVKERTYNMGNQTFTGWSGGAGLSYTTKSQASAAVPAGSVVATSIVNRQTYMAKSAPDILTYTVTKVDNGKTVTQVVEAGDNTGKIAYAGKTNYVFAGWYLDKSCTKAADFSAVSSDMTVYAKYVKTSAVKLSFTKKSSKSGSVTFKADLKISGAPELTDTAVNCDCKGKTSAVKFTGAKTTKSGKTEVNTYTGTVTVSGLKDKGSFTAAISYKTPDGTTVNLAEKTCKYASGLVTVK